MELEKGNLIKRIRNYVPILIPLIVNAIRRSIELAEALESRAFGSSEKRESLITLRMKSLDFIVMIVTIILLALAIYVNFFVQLPTIDIPLRIPRIWPWEIIQNFVVPQTRKTIRFLFERSCDYFGNDCLH
jgi:hypothetical protein